ncbi:succinate dehydrogenase cytochrome b558 subunit [Botrimarina hoheduenensis]|uniref:Succinate dehydrogenase cytochrome b558 subunit n=1 Tax=Botrimarina hoheduenensis TaxID=2528000 RepID=A0A5C5W8L7_9BACT|nr:succinate dehydrogenase cytochrome b558 subunit [Botrimarina hoheduenensis]TWT47236.1 Succinate dehydrogenase cytochrome b558 subunit [Botrimarina hoheduenensis]
MAAASPSFLERNEFLIRRLHSLTGLVPVGAFMCVHLSVNASVLDSPQTFQNNVYSIHALGSLLPLVEWATIFLPLIFHAVIGVWIIKSGLPNTSAYAYGGNIRYTLQRASGMVAMVFILYHVFHMHGWFHADWWLALAEPLGGHQFRPYNAPSTAGAALQNPLIVAFYAVGILASVFHLANGLWTMGITWGVWTSPKAQKRALAACGVFGVALLAVGFSGLGGMMAVGSGEAFDESRAAETKMFEARVEQGLVSPDSPKWIENHPVGGDHAEAHPSDYDLADEDLAEDSSTPDAAQAEGTPAETPAAP